MKRVVVACAVVPLVACALVVGVLIATAGAIVDEF